ncbi:hypothetical protein RBWH47_02325 [Rhodopirellula baltica WH47]|uniref:Uncharacterized protein n=1 Tax=Rhodopirellula baltica WH47 TaxID=991778 RepID=F2AKM5_RHOBT|nr:hypothetical protein RBWH47_02325 [Rhodopirellula baltica WH47]
MYRGGEFFPNKSHRGSGESARENDPSARYDAAGVPSITSANNFANVLSPSP